MRSGSTLIELTILLAIIALMAGIAIPQVHRQFQRMVKTQAEILCAEIRKHQQYAQIGNKELVMHFDTATHNCNSTIASHTLPHSVRFGCLPGAMGPPSVPTQPIRSSISFPNQQIHFFPNGTIDAGTIYLVDSSRTIMYAVTVGIAAVQFIRIYQYTGQWKPVS